MFVSVTGVGVLFSVIIILTVLEQKPGFRIVTEYVPGVITEIAEPFAPVLQEYNPAIDGPPVTESVMDGLLQVSTVDGVATIVPLGMKIGLKLLCAVFIQPFAPVPVTV